jgi:hypothetical protein
MISRGGPRGGRWSSAWGATLALALAHATACGSDPAGPESELTMSATSSGFVYHWTPGDEEPDTAYQERHLAWVLEGLGIIPDRRLEYFKYRDATQLERLTGHDRGSGFAEDGTYRFHSVYARENHEYVHALVSAQVGTPPALFSEGIAVAHHGASLVGSFDGDPLWNGASARDRVRLLQSIGGLPDMSEILENEAFQRLPADVTYPVAGLFVRYLLDEAGAAPLLALIASCPRGAAAPTIRARFRDAYGGDDIDVWWSRWLAAL